jgi:hypothetical protein
MRFDGRPICNLKLPKKGLYLGMNPTTKIELIRDLAKSKILELQPFAGEEMNLLETDPHRTGFVDGERTLAQQILALIEDDHAFCPSHTEPVEDEMVLSLGRT